MPGATGVGAHRGIGGMTAGEEHRGHGSGGGKHRSVGSKGRAWRQAGRGGREERRAGREVELIAVSPLAQMGR